eukprot:TRINITY_DN3401_c0_g1_i2.p1 TRINITY_DN3401_c0_g1~~TRINITY_DN3401_c0_g1_i2.p1  ORF type:complete len:689 (-),score=118.39 TRINITY_DN3401_c0_g1_i2:12-2078(-)
MMAPSNLLGNLRRTVLVVLLSSLLLLASSTEHEPEHCSFLAQAPISTATTAAPDVASALAALKGVQQGSSPAADPALVSPAAAEPRVSVSSTAARDVASALASLKAAQQGSSPAAEPGLMSPAAEPPVSASTTTAPDVASALAELKAAQWAASSSSPSKPASAPPAASSSPSFAPDLASTLAAARHAAKDGASSRQVPQTPPAASSSAEASPAPAPHLAADLMALFAGAGQKMSTENARVMSTTLTSTLPTVKLTKQYVPIDKNGHVIAYKTAYFGKVHVGSPQPQDFTVVFDTGSAHLVLPSTACESKTCIAHRRYNDTLSSISYPIEHDGTPLPRGASSSHSVSIVFGTGTVAGTFVRDRACLGGFAQRNGNADCTSMNVVVAKEMSEQPFSLFHFDGILGLGLEALALGPGYSFFGQMVEQHPAMLPRFSVFLARTDQGESSISFGGHDESKAASDLYWVPVALPELGYWQVQVHQVRIGDEILDDCADGGCRAILDTGTSLLGAPRQAVKSLHQLLSRDVLLAPQGAGSGEGQVTAEAGKEAASQDCRLRDDGALLIFELGPGIPSIALDPEDYFRPRPFNMTVPGKPGAWKLSCRSLLLPLDLEEPLGPRTFILGEPVLRKYYTIYDWASRRIGFATADHSNDGEGEGAVGAPQAGSMVAGAPLPVLKQTHTQASARGKEMAA